MSDYMEEHSAARLIGAPPGYLGYDKEGGILAKTVGKKDSCVLLLDEYEKAHTQVYNTFLQIMDNGALTDPQGKTIDFTNVILIMTSNIGANDITKAAPGFIEQTAKDHNADYNAAISGRFAPEFRNRLDKIITFKHLEPEDLTKITKILVSEMNRLPVAEDKNISFAASPRAVKAMVEQSYDKAMGARPIKRFMNDNIKDMLAEELLSRDISDKKILLTYSSKDNSFKINEKPLPKSSQPKAIDAPTQALELPQLDMP
jgi:ATP-dependent Clp protease ATP-binding subunit ClpA